jgi:hypothetical protein
MTFEFGMVLGPFQKREKMVYLRKGPLKMQILRKGTTENANSEKRDH